MNFQEFNLHRNINQAIDESNYVEPTPIQQLIIPKILEEKDIVACSETGTGKTASFVLPILNYLIPIVGSLKKRKVVRVLILSPTRELAIQTHETIENFSKYTSITSALIFGGVNQESQVKSLKVGVDIVIATPGRLLDLMKQGILSLTDVGTLVLDEADIMLDFGFLNDIKKIIKVTSTNKQTLLFSATLPFAIRELAEEVMNKPEYISAIAKENKIDLISQKVYLVEKESKRTLLLEILQNKEISKALIFVRTKHGADNLAKFLKKNDIKCDAFHGDKSQSARQRVYQSFVSNEIDFLIATDIASRGLDIDLLPFVINFELPNIPETFIHRIGRTGRAGNKGVAISFCSKDEKGYLSDIEKLLKTKIKIVTGHNYPWKEGSEATPEKKDFRKTTTNKNNSNTNSRKSTASKKNKKRWY